MRRTSAPVGRHALALAWDEWFASKEGQRCADIGLLSTPAQRQYLNNRLWLAFMAGADAQQDAGCGSTERASGG